MRGSNKTKRIKFRNKKNTLNDSDLGQEKRPIENYFYSFDEEIDANYLYYNSYITGSSNTINSRSSLNPYLDTLNFHTFPLYEVVVNNQLETVSSLLSLTPENIDNYSTLYPLDETNTATLNWCNEMLVEEEGDCDETVEVSFDSQFATTGTGDISEDTQLSPASYSGIISKKEVTFTEAWTDIASIEWDDDLGRYDPPDSDASKVMRVTFCTGICDSARTDASLVPCSDEYEAEKFTDINNDGTFQDGIDEFDSINDDEHIDGVWTGCYDSTFVIDSLKISNSLPIQSLDSDSFDSLVYVGIIDTNRFPVNSTMLVDRGEWARFDTVYKSDDKNLYLDTTFTYKKFIVPDDSPMYRVNGDCNQNLQWDKAELYFDFGPDMCPDSLETGADTYTDVNENGTWEESEPFINDWNEDEKWTKAFCEVIDLNSDGDIIDEDPCNCGNEVNAEWVIAKATSNDADCIEKGGYWLTYGTNECEYDPNGDNWRDCGIDGYCPGNPKDTNSDENETELNEKWDPSENMELNGRYDFDIVNGIGEYFFDKPNDVPNEPAEFCDMDGDGVCDPSDLFEDRNCNGKWDDAESGHQGNGIWDDDEAFMDLNGDEEWTQNGNFGASYETNCYLPAHELEEVLGLNEEDNNSDEDICSEAPGCSWSLDYKICYSDGDDEPLYALSDRLETLIVDYSDGFANRIKVTDIDTNTAVIFYYGTYENFVQSDTTFFFKRISIDAEYEKYFYDVERKETIYTNKIVEDLLPGVAEDYHVTKTKWYQDIGGTSFVESHLDNPNYGINYGYDYHLFKISENGNIIKMVHPAFFYYYGYYTKFEDIELGSWKEELLQEEVFIYSVDGFLRAGEEYYHDTTIVTPFADYRVQELYEVGFDNSLVVPFAKVTYNIVEGDTVCINEPNAGWLGVQPGLEEEIVIESNYMQNCPPVLDTLTNTFKITKTKTITMVGNGVEFGLRNTFWLGTAGENDPLGIVKDQLEIRWSEPYWEEYGSDWRIMSILELRSLRKSVLGRSRLFGIFQPTKKVSLMGIGNEEGFNNDPFVPTPSYGLHRLRKPND